MAKAEVARTKVDEEALTASRTRTRTQTSLEGTTILHQMQTLSPLGGNQTGDLQPVPRRKPNHEQGTQRATEDGDHSNSRKCSCFVRMARKLQKKGFDQTCPAEF